MINNSLLTLGIETSQRQGSVALCHEGKLLGLRSLDQTGRRHARSLVAEINELFLSAGRRLSDCELLAVSTGPGSFTGLRVGIICAKTIAYATGCRLAAVDTFQCIATISPDGVRELFVIADAQRSELFVGKYLRDSKGHFQRQGEIELADRQTWIEERTSDQTVSGPAADQHRENLQHRCRVLDTEACFPRADAVALLGEREIQLGRETDFWKLVPFYFRKSAAEEKWMKDQR